MNFQSKLPSKNKPASNGVKLLTLQRTKRLEKVSTQICIVSILIRIYFWLTCCYAHQNFCKDEYLLSRDEFVCQSKLWLKDRTVMNGSAAFDNTMNGNSRKCKYTKWK